MKKGSELHPMLATYLDGLDASTDGRGFDAKHETARQFVEAACAAFGALPLFYVVPDWKYDGDDNAGFVRAETPEAAITALAANMFDVQLKLTRAARPKETGDETWAVFEVPKSGAAGVVDWETVPRQDFTAAD